MTPMITRLLRDDSPRAKRFGMYAICSLAARTLAAVSGATSSGRLIARLAVIGDTPASRATSARVATRRGAARAAAPRRRRRRPASGIRAELVRRQQLERPDERRVVPRLAAAR